MEAKETVIRNEDIMEMDIPCEDCHREPSWKTGKATRECMECMALKHREAQAEISFRAGREEGEVIAYKNAYKAGYEAKESEFELAKVSLAEVYDNGIKQGRKEVVEWVEEHIPKTLGNYVGFWQMWQSQLKKWEI